MHNYKSSYLVKKSAPWIDQAQDEYQFLILHKISGSTVELQTNSLSRKDCFNLSLLNDFSAVSDVSISPDSYRNPVLNNILHTSCLILKNTEANHINLNFNCQFDQRSLKNYQNPLNRGLKNKQKSKISVRNYEGNGIIDHIEFFNKLIKSCKISSLGFESFPLPQILQRSLQEQQRYRFQAPRLKEFGLRLAHLSELLLQDPTTDQFSLQFSHILSPCCAPRYRLLPTHHLLHTLTLNPLQLAPLTLNYLFDILEVASHLKTLTIGLQEINRTIMEPHKPVPANNSVREFNLIICDLSTDEVLAASLNLFLTNIDFTFPSLTKFSLGSHRKDFSYTRGYNASTLELGTYLKGLATLKHLHTVSIDTDISKRISFDFLGGCKTLESLKLRMNSMLESVRIATLPNNLKDLNIIFHPIKCARNLCHQTIVLSFMTVLNKKIFKNDCIESLSLIGVEINIKAASLIRFCSLIKLNLIECRINENDLSKMLNYEGLVSLRELCLSRTLLVDSADIVSNTNILKFLGKTRLAKQLEVLDLSEFRLAKTIGAPEGSEQQFKHLRKLELQNNNLQLDGLKNVIHAKFPKLEELNIENIDLTSDVIINFLLNKLSYISHIKYIYLSYKCYTISYRSDPRNIEATVNRFFQKSRGLPRLRMNMETKFSWNCWNRSNLDTFVFSQ